jgi:hypothetical protein
MPKADPPLTGNLARLPSLWSGAGRWFLIAGFKFPFDFSLTRLRDALSSFRMTIAILFILAQNLVQNPGFEQWTGDLPDFWNLDDSIAVCRESGTIHGDAYSAKVTLLTQSQEFADLHSDLVAVRSGLEDTFSIWVLDQDPAGKARIGVWWEGSSAYYGAYSKDSTGWQRLVAIRTCPAGVNSVSIGLRFYDDAAWDGDAVFYVDDAYVTEPPGNIAPVIADVTHRPTNPCSTNIVVVRARITDDGVVVADSLMYSRGIDSAWTVITHDSISGDMYYYQIVPLPSGAANRYCVVARDDSGDVSVSDTTVYRVGKEGIVINEIYYDSDGPDVGCFVELKGAPGTDLADWLLVGVNGSDGDDYNRISLSGHAIPSDSYFVIAQDVSVPNADFVTSKANMQNGPDNVQVRCDGITIDGLGYGGFADACFAGEREPVAATTAGQSLGREPDGEDTDDNSADFAVFDSPTPGERNVRVSVEEGRKASSDEFTVSSTITSKPVRICLPGGGRVKIYDLLGRSLCEIRDSKRAGELEWSLRDWKDKQIESGPYFLKYGNDVRKIIVIRKNRG